MHGTKQKIDTNVAISCSYFNAYHEKIFTQNDIGHPESIWTESYIAHLSEEYGKYCTPLWHYCNGVPPRSISIFRIFPDVCFSLRRIVQSSLIIRSESDFSEAWDIGYLKESEKSDKKAFEKSQYFLKTSGRVSWEVLLEE